MFQYYALFIFGICLISLSIKITPLVKDSSDRAQQSTQILQILGIVITSISFTRLVMCKTKKIPNTVVIALLIALLGVTTGLFAIIHADCEDARIYTSYSLGFTVLILASLIFLKSRRKAKEPQPAIHGFLVGQKMVIGPEELVKPGDTNSENKRIDEVIREFKNQTDKVRRSNMKKIESIIKDSEDRTAEVQSILAGQGRYAKSLANRKKTEIQ